MKQSDTMKGWIGTQQVGAKHARRSNRRVG
jgi:hypothetical protein